MDTVADVALKLIEALSPVLLAGIAWLAKLAAGWISAHTKNAYVQGVLLRLNDAVFTGVKQVEQTLSDGSKTDAEKKAAALAAIKSHWGAKGLEEAMAILGLTSSEFGTMLESKVEAAVHDLGMAKDVVAAGSAAATAPLPK